MDSEDIRRMRQILANKESEIDQLERLVSLTGQLKPRIVVYGTYNAGKSTLLNALTGHFQTECFRVNDIPETREEQTYENNQFVYVDTPGLDVNASDNRAANYGVAAADVVLIVHRLAAGSLQQEDVLAFQPLLNGENALLVLTGAEQPEEDRGLIAEITATLHRASAVKIPVFPVSTPRYLKGMRENKRQLIAASGIQPLIEELERRGASLREALVGDRHAKQAQLIDNLLLAARMQQQSVQATAARKTASIIERHQQFASAVQSLQRELKTKIMEYKKLM